MIYSILSRTAATARNICRLKRIRPSSTPKTIAARGHLSNLVHSTQERLDLTLLQSGATTWQATRQRLLFVFLLRREWKLSQKYQISLPASGDRIRLRRISASASSRAPAGGTLFSVKLPSPRDFRTAGQ